MKKLMAALIAVGLLAGTASAQEVLSRNAVGYVKVDVPSTGLNLVSTPFVNFDGSEQSIADIFGDGVPAGSTIHMWDPVSATYSLASFIPAFGGWVDGGLNPVGNTVIGRGQGVWFENPDVSPLELFIMGEVPDEDFNQESIELVEGLSLISFAYPVEIDLDDPDANLNANAGDTIHAWDPDSATYSLVSYIPAFGGWVDGDLNPVDVISIPGKSFWYETATSQTWTNVRPYTWP